VPAGTMCMRFNSSVRPLVALLVFLLYIRYAPAVVASLNARDPALNYLVLLAVLYHSFPSLLPRSLFALYSLLPHSLVPSPTLRYGASLVDTDTY
jgi:hypothetical protein